MATESFGQKFFENGLNAGGVITTPNALSDQARSNLKKSIEARSRPENAHKAMLLEEGMTWNKITFSPEEAQFLGSREFQNVEIARWFNLPLRMLKIPNSTGFSNVEQISIEMIQSTMLPRYVVWEQELNCKLFGVGTSRFCEFNIDGILRGDSRTRADVNHIMRLDGIINANEWRMRENMNPIDGDIGEEYWSQPNLAANKTNSQTDTMEEKEEQEEKETEAEPTNGGMTNE
jgi:HK97 family phage portal protein